MPEEIAPQTAELVGDAESTPAAEQQDQDLQAEGAESAPADEQTPEQSENTENAQGAAPADEPKVKLSEHVNLRKRAQTAEQERDFWREQAIRSNQQQPQAQPVATQQQQQPPEEPKLEKFESFDQYQAAHDAWLVDKAKREAVREFQQMQDSQRQQEHVVRVNNEYEQRYAEAVKRDPELPEKLRNWIPQHPAVFAAIKEDEHGPEIAGYLASNPEEAIRLQKMAPLSAVREIGKIGVKLEKASAPTTPVRKVSQAPEPVTPVRPAGGAVKNVDDMSVDEYIAYMNSLDRAKGHR